METFDGYDCRTDVKNGFSTDMKNERNGERNFHDAKT